jgi:ATP-dependent helicase/DNAse subunit B
MRQTVVVDTAPAGSGKTGRLLDRFRSALREARPKRPRAYWITPSARLAADVRERLIDEGGTAVLSPGIFTFGQLAQRILVRGRVRISSLSAIGERHLVRHALRRAIEAGELKSFRNNALSSGYVDLVVSHFRELKRRGIGSARLLGSPILERNAAEGHELAKVYEDYENLLAKNKLTDRVGRLAIARDLMAGGEPAFSEIELVVVDGFTDFSPIELDLLDQLAKRSGELHISLPYDHETGDAVEGSRQFRTDLFAKCAETLAELVRRYPDLIVFRHEPQPCGWPALDHLERHLFRNPYTVPKASPATRASLHRLEIIGAAGNHDEIVQIARRVKGLLASGDARPDEIGVVFRMLRPTAQRVHEVFSEFGIPYYLDALPRVIAAPIIKTLLQLLRLAEEDWPFRRLVATLENNTLTALESHSRLTADWLVRDLQIAAGRNELLQAIGRMVDEQARLDELSEHQQRRVAAAVVALPVLRQLAGALDELPKVATPREWCEALRTIGGRLGLHSSESDVLRRQSCGDQLPSDLSSSADAEVVDAVAWNVLVQHLAEIERLAMTIGGSKPQWSRRELLPHLIEVSAHAAIPQLQDDAGRVRVLSALAARHISAKHLFLAGMSEQAFPAPQPAGLYSDAQYRAIEKTIGMRAGSDSKSTRPQEEMLLFYEIITRARETITISYPALDDKAQSLPPSSYVTEIERVIGEKNVAPCRKQPQLAPVPCDGLPLCPSDWRLQAVDSALNGDRTLLAGLMRSDAAAGRAIEAGLSVIHARSRPDFGRTDGLLASVAIRERLARRFGAQHYWSPTQWEHYASCPYSFFLRDVLDFQPLGDLTLATDFRRRGGLLHQLLADFHREHMHAGSAAADQRHFSARMQSALDAAVSTGPQSGIDAALLELDRRQVARWVEKYYDHWMNYMSEKGGLDEPPVPTHFELRFGPARAGEISSDDPNSTDTAFELDIGGETLRVTGRIDRIDVGRAGGRTVFTVIDYKTGRTPSLKPEQIASGERLQLPIYVAAAQALFFGGQATPVSAGYWTMDRGFDRRGALNVLQEAIADPANTDEWDDLRRQAIAQIREFVAQIRHGDFPVYSRDEHCTGRCEFSTVCRVAQVRALGKMWPR